MVDDKNESNTLKDAVSHCFSKDLSEDKLQGLLARQARCQIKKRRQVLWIPIVCAAVLLLFLSISAVRHRHLQFLSKHYVAEYMSLYMVGAYKNGWGRPPAVRPGVSKREAPAYAMIKNSSVFVGGSLSHLPPATVNYAGWEARPVNSFLMANGGTAYHYRLINSATGETLMMVVFEGVSNADEIHHPIHRFQDGLNIRIWKEKNRIISIAGESPGLISLIENPSEQ